MEDKAEAIVAPQTAIEAVRPPKTKNNVVNEVYEGGKKKKKRGAMHLLRVAMFMLRRRSGKSKAIDVGSNGMWKQVVGSMRPLHLQSNQSPPPLIHGGDTPVPPSPIIEHFEDVFPAPFSPGASSSSSHSIDGMSRYASAVNLQELDRNESSDNEKEEIGPDEMIDVKAEMFIAQFYEQMKLQRMDSIHRYNQMIKRSME